MSCGNNNNNNNHNHHHPRCAVRVPAASSIGPLTAVDSSSAQLDIAPSPIPWFNPRAIKFHARHLRLPPLTSRAACARYQLGRKLTAAPLSPRHDISAEEHLRIRLNLLLDTLLDTVVALPSSLTSVIHTPDRASSSCCTPPSSAPSCSIPPHAPPILNLPQHRSTPRSLPTHPPSNPTDFFLLNTRY
ncbi:hypothetical protein B0H13DRAFT_2326521 [Mycena leptocephala]|nr:hypothetical protein B0H13DRAFT_2326521 [Mycena leptocephala]